MPVFRFILFKEERITLEIEALTQEDAREKAENGEGKEVNRESESELQDW